VKAPKFCLVDENASDYKDDLTPDEHNNDEFKRIQEF